MTALKNFALYVNVSQYFQSICISKSISSGSQFIDQLLRGDQLRKTGYNRLVL